MRFALVSLLIAFLAQPMSASLILSSPDQTSGTGLGAVNTVLTVQTPSGTVRTESGCVSWNGMSSVTGPTACPPGFAGGDEQGITQTRTLDELGLDSAFNLRVVFNYNEDNNDNVTLENLVLRIVGVDGTVLFDSGPFDSRTFDEPFSGTGNSGFVYRLDAQQALEANQYFDNPNNRIGLATTITGAEGGIETFFVANATAIGTPEADVSITKSDSPDPVVAGNSLTYTLTARNDGPNTATNVRVVDNLPSSVSVDSTSSSAGSCTTSGQTVICTFDTLAVGTEETITIVVTPQDSGQNTITNSAVISADQADPDTSNNGATESTEVQATPSEADLSVTKSDSPDPVSVGETLTYTITVDNAGPDGATDVTVTDILPSSVTFQSASASSGSCNHDGGTVSCDLGSIADGGSATVTITVIPQSAGQITNRVSVTGDEPDPNASNDSDSESTTVEPLTADLSLTKTDSTDPATVSVSFDYLLEVENLGPDLAENVIVRDTLPASVTFVSASSSTGSCSASGNVVTCDLGAVAASATETITITVTPNTANTTIYNSATVSTDSVDPDASNNTATERTDVDGGSSTAADLSISKTDGSDPVVVGSNFDYTITVDNLGPDEATNVTVTDFLPDSVSFVSSTAACSEDSGTVSCSLGTIPSGSGTSFDITVQANEPGVATNEVTVSADQRDDDSSDNNASEDTTILPATADLALTKSDSVDPVAESSTLIYTLEVDNLGPDDAPGVTVVDTLPNAVTFVDATPDQGTCSASGRTVTCDLGTVPNGGNVSIAIEVTTDDLDRDRTILNTALVSSDAEDANGSNDSASEETTIDATPAQSDLRLAKTDAPDPATVGSTLTYTLTVTNDGPDEASGVTVSDSLPSGVSYQSATSTQGSCSQSGGVVSCMVGTLANGTSATITIEVTPTRTGSLTNSATTSADQNDPDTSNNSATETTQVGGTAPVTDLALVKTGAPDPVRVGQPLTYTITVDNFGPDQATGVEVVDNLPASVNFESATSTSGACSESGGVVTCGLGTVNVGDTETVTIVVRPTTQGDVLNTAAVSSNESEPAPANNQDSNVTTVAPAAVTDIPTTDEWALIILTLLLGSVGVFFTRQS